MTVQVGVGVRPTPSHYLPGLPECPGRTGNWGQCGSVPTPEPRGAPWLRVISLACRGVLGPQGSEGEEKGE